MRKAKLAYPRKRRVKPPPLATDEHAKRYVWNGKHSFLDDDIPF
jgi:hypothetical protein